MIKLKEYLKELEEKYNAVSIPEKMFDTSRVFNRCQKLFKYGMKRRGFSIGCQPSGVIKFEDVSKNETGYYSIIYYDRLLSDLELVKFELEYLGGDSNE